MLHLLRISEGLGVRQELASGQAKPVLGADCTTVAVMSNCFSGSQRHSVRVTDPGLEIAKKSNQAGVPALQESNIRLKRLGVSFITILVAIPGLYLKIHQIESRPQA